MALTERAELRERSARKGEEVKSIPHEGIQNGNHGEKRAQREWHKTARAVAEQKEPRKTS